MASLPLMTGNFPVVVYFMGAIAMPIKVKESIDTGDRQLSPELEP